MCFDRLTSGLRFEPISLIGARTLYTVKLMIVVGKFFFLTLEDKHLHLKLKSVTGYKCGAHSKAQQYLDLALHRF